MNEHFTTKLRRNQTPWERKLWLFLRNRGICGMKFRRQFKIDKYIVDFFCPSKKLIIELDGGHHMEDLQEKKDQERQSYLENLGYTVLRFYNNDIDNNFSGVMEKIKEACEKK